MILFVFFIMFCTSTHTLVTASFVRSIDCIKIKLKKLSIRELDSSIEIFFELCRTASHHPTTFQTKNSYLHKQISSGWHFWETCGARNSDTYVTAMRKLFREIGQSTKKNLGTWTILHVTIYLRNWEEFFFLFG